MHCAGNVVDFAASGDHCFILHDPPRGKRALPHSGGGESAALRDVADEDTSPSSSKPVVTTSDSVVAGVPPAASPILATAASQDGTTPSLQISRIRALSAAQLTDVHLR